MQALKFQSNPTSSREYAARGNAAPASTPLFQSNPTSSREYAEKRVTREYLESMFQSNPTSSREYAGPQPKPGRHRFCFNPTRPVAGNMRPLPDLVEVPAAVSIQPDQ